MFKKAYILLLAIISVNFATEAYSYSEKDYENDVDNIRVNDVNQLAVLIADYHEKTHNFPLQEFAFSESEDPKYNFKAINRKFGGDALFVIITNCSAKYIIEKAGWFKEQKYKIFKQDGGELAVMENQYPNNPNTAFVTKTFFEEELKKVFGSDYKLPLDPEDGFNTQKPYFYIYGISTETDNIAYSVKARTYNDIVPNKFNLDYYEYAVGYYSENAGDTISIRRLYNIPDEELTESKEKAQQSKERLKAFLQA